MKLRIAHSNICLIREYIQCIIQVLFAITLEPRLLLHRSRGMASDISNDVGQPKILKHDQLVGIHTITHTSSLQPVYLVVIAPIYTYTNPSPVNAQHPCMCQP